MILESTLISTNKQENNRTEPNASFNENVSLLKSSREYAILQQLMKKTRLEYYKDLLYQRNVNQWPTLFTLQILLWKNFTIRKRKKKQFFFLLFQILLWLTIACFNLSYRSTVYHYPEDVSPQLSQLIPTTWLNGFDSYIGISFNTIIPFFQNITLENDSLRLEKNTLSFIEKEVLQILNGVTLYFQKNYFGTLPKFRLYTNKRELMDQIKLDPSILYGIHFDSVNLKLIDSLVNYTLIFRGKDVPKKTATANGLECRKPLEQNPASTDTCPSSVYGKHGLLFIQTAVNNAIIDTIVNKTKSSKSMQSKNESINFSSPEQPLRFLGSLTGTKSLYSLENKKEIMSQLMPPTNFALRFPGLFLIAEPFPQYALEGIFPDDNATTTPFCFIIILISLFAFVLMDIVTEKETRVKHIMEIYGASKTILWVSNLLTYALENVVITFIAIFVIKITGAFGKKHSCLLIALLIYVYLMSSTTLAFMISTFFYKSRTASLATMLFNLVLYFSSGLIYQAQMSSILIRGLCMLFSTITFSLAIIEMLIHVPFKGLSISDCFNFNAPDHSMGVYFFFLIFDTFLYFFLTIIFDKYGEIWYNRIGSNCNMVQLKCYKTYTSIKESFSSLLCYRNSNHVGNASENEVLLTLEESENFETNIEDNTSDFTMSCVIEPVSYEIGLRRVAVRAQNISKNYHFDKSPNKAYSKKKSRKAVVEYFSLELYDGEIFALLGHNNAGKTTTINMLSGIIPVDTGSVFIYDDKVKMGNTRIRRFISVCPQKNIFFKELSCMEHIIFFAGLRGIDIREGIKTLRKGVRYFEEVLLAKKELEEKRNEIATLLINSGGKLAQEEFLRILDNEKKFSCYGLSLFLDEKQEKMNMLNNLCETSIAVSTWNDILSMIEEVGLTEQLFCTPRCLSDGMKRRLWLVIALLGNPKILILDEPTSGLNSMDRQQIWKIIQNEKKSDRCIIVTTNYMEEADILADRKGIIVSGRICCLGTSDFLKYKFSINYSLEIVADSNSIKNKQRYIFECLLPFIQSMIPEATYDCEKSERLQHRVRRLKSTVLDYNETYFVFTLPVTSTDTFSFFFNKLEACKNELNICNYRLSLATLEDVFYEIGSLSMSRTEGVYPPLLKKTPKKDLENELFPYSDVHQTDQTFHSEKKAENVKWKIENETKTKNRCEMSKDTILEVETRAAKQPNLWNYLITYWDFLCQKKKLQLILQWDNVKAISRLRYLQIIRNKTHFHIDVILPILVLIGSFFINEDSPGYLNSLIFQEKTVPVMLNQYDFFLQSPIPFHIDSQLSEAQIKKAYQFLSFFPNEFRKKFIEVGSFELSVIAGSNNGNINFASDITNSFLAENKVNISYKKNNVNLSYDKYLLPLHSSIKFTNLNGQSLRNFFYQTRQNISRVNDYVFGLNFESKGTEVSGATTHYTWHLNEEFIIRLFYNPGFPHILPNFVSLLSDVILKWHVNEISSANNVTNKLDPSTKVQNQANIELAKFTASEKVQKLREPEQFVFTFHTYNLPLPVHKPVYMTSMTYGVYLILSVVLTILPTRFGTQIMLEKIQGTKHAMIVMGLPIADYWFGNFAINYIAMLFGNFLMSLCIAYFFSLFRSYILIPILICALFHSAAVLLYAYFLSHCFSTIKSYTNALQLSTFILSLAPAYFVSIFADITDSDREWNYLVKMIHLVSSLLLPQYNPIGSLLGCAIIEEKYKRLGKKPKLSDFFLFEHLPIWNVIGSAAQAVILYGAIIWVDYVSYSFKKCSKKNRELLKHLYERKVSLKMTCTNSLAANLSLIQEYLKNEKDLGVLFEEQECQKLSDALLQNNVRDETIIQEEFFLKKSNLMREDNKSSVHMFPLVLMHNIHYLSPANCTKQYPIVPLKGLSLRVYRGEIMGIVGPKGAGKTTCLSLLSCYPTTPAPTRGKAFIGGYDVCKHATKVFGHLGVCPQHEALWHDISVRENIEILSRIKLISKDKRKRFIDNYIHIWGLESCEHMRLGDCSIGNKRLVSVAVAFIGNPKVVILDEPLRGVDPEGRQKISSYIKNHCQSRCIIVSTHRIEEAETLCTKLGILVNGKLDCIGTSLAIRSDYGSGIRLEILFSPSHHKYSEKNTLVELESQWSSFLSSKLNITLNVLNFFANRVVYSLPLGSNALGDLFYILQSSKDVFKIREFSISQPTIEQIYLNFAARQRPAQATSQFVLSE